MRLVELKTCEKLPTGLPDDVKAQVRAPPRPMGQVLMNWLSAALLTQPISVAMALQVVVQLAITKHWVFDARGVTPAASVVFMDSAKDAKVFTVEWKAVAHGGLVSCCPRQ